MRERGVKRIFISAVLRRVARMCKTPPLLAVEVVDVSKPAMMLLNNGAKPNDDRTSFAPLHALSWVLKPELGDNQRGNPPLRSSRTMTILEFCQTTGIACR